MRLVKVDTHIRTTRSLRAPWRSLAAHVPGSPALRAWQNGIRGYTYVLRTYVGHSVRTHVRTYVYTHVRPHTYPNSLPGTYVRMRIVRTRWALSPSPTVCVAAHFLPRVRAHVATRPSQDRRISKFAPRRYVRTCVRRTYVRRSLRAYVRPRCAARYMRASDMCCSMLVVGARSAHSPSVSVPCFRAHARVYVRTYAALYVRTCAEKKQFTRSAMQSRALQYVRTCVLARRPARCRC